MDLISFGKEIQLFSEEHLTHDERAIRPPRHLQVILALNNNNLLYLVEFSFVPHGDMGHESINMDRAGN